MALADIESYSFSDTGIATLGTDDRELNWPVIYQIYNDSRLYVGETTNLKSRMSQHLKSGLKNDLEKFSVVFDQTYNKSVALDLESQLIQWFSGDGKYDMLNKNSGVAEHDYFDRSIYQKQFQQIWDRLRQHGIAQKTVQQIENSGLFKFSPYKRLNQGQLDVVGEVLVDLDEAFLRNSQTISVIGGNEGTGKTIVIMYLIKLIKDIQDHNVSLDDFETSDETFEMYFKDPFNSRFKHKSLAVVIPSPSLKGSITKIFKGISNLNTSVDVLSPIEFGSNKKNYDITFVDEAHLLKKSNQEVHKANRNRVDSINATLFNDGQSHTELDWIIHKSKNVVMVYGDQRVRPNNITGEDMQDHHVREHILKSQMRSSGGELYIDYLRSILSSRPPLHRQHFDNFEFKLYGDFKIFLDAIKNKEQSDGLSRLVAGFAWDWKSKKDRAVNDITIDEIGLKWNSTLIDWVGSPKSVDEVGSIYTIQGYDLNYCGVIIGNDLQYDPVNRKLVFSKADYYDRGAKKRTKQQLETNTPITNDELLDQVLRTYRILMNRSIKGTFLYVCDDNLRDYLSQYVNTSFKLEHYQP